MESEKRISRRQFLKRLAIPIGMATLELSGILALFLSDKTRINSNDIPTPTPVSKPPERLKIEPTFPIKEISEKNLTAKETGSFIQSDIATTWANLTDNHFIEKKAKDVFLYFETLSERLKELPYIINNITFTTFKLEKTKANSRLFLILPEEVSMPKYQNDPNYETPALTYTLEDGKKHLSYIRINNSTQNLPESAAYKNEIEDANLKFFIESCQSSLKVKGENEGENVFGQEIVCNSLGIAFLLKQSGISYKDYEKWASDVTIGPTPKEQYPLMVIPKEEFENIPRLDFVIVKKTAEFKTSRTPIDY